MLPLNTGLPKTSHGLSIYRCHKPCPSVIPNTDQPRLQLRPLSPNPVLPQHFTRWQAPPIPTLVGVSSNGVAFWVILKITGGFGVIAPFIPPLLKYNCQYYYYDNWTKVFL